MFPCRIGLLALLGAAAIVLPHSLHAENVALGKTATVTSGAGGHYLTDGLSTTNSRWLADYGYPQTAEVDLGGTYTINSVIFKQDAERTDGYQVQVRTGGSWVTVGTGTGNTAVNITVNFTPVAADRVRFIVTSGEYYLKVYELEVMAGGGGGDTQAPSTPTGVAATPVGPDRIDLTWNAATDNVGVTGYRIYRNGIQVGTSATTSFFDTGLSPSTNYTYRVAAYDAADNLGNQSSPVSATTGAGGSTNVALGCPVTVSSGVGASFLTDGLYTSNSRWFADYGYPQWAEVDLGTQYVVHQVVFAQDLERVTDYEVQIWNGLAWDVVATGTNNSALTITADFVPVVTDKVRFRVTSGEYYLRVFELEVYGEAGGGFATIVENITPSDAWPSQMEIATADPALSGNAVTVNGSTIASQTITPTSPFNLGSISFKYSTSVTSATNAFTVRIQEVPGGASAQTYSAGTDLFGATPITFGLASTGGQTRILRIDLGGSLQIPLAAGTTYAVEILSNGPAMTLYRRGADSYSGGLLYTNRSAFNYPSTRDLAMALGEAGQDLPDSDGDGMDNAWEIANGLDPNNAADASEDPDGDGLTNLQEYLAGTDPNVPNGGSNVVTASVQSANAYELENGYAAVRFNRTGGTNAITVNFSRSGAAGTSDYTVRDSSGNALNGSVTIPAGASSVTLWIDPTADALNEYPETATITIESGSGYTVGAQASASVTINDATDIPANEKLFVASLLHPECQVPHPESE
jgi:chitodextrinase